MQVPHLPVSRCGWSLRAGSARCHRWQAQSPEKNALFLLAVKLCGRLELRLGGLKGLTLAFDRAEETRFIAFVAGRAGLLHLDEQTVAVAVEGDILDGLRIAAFLALHPEFLA